jgi:hypothetical protein
MPPARVSRRTGGVLLFTYFRARAGPLGGVAG